MVMQGDGTPLFFPLDEKSRLVDKGPRQRPRTDFFRAYRASLESEGNEDVRTQVPGEIDLLSVGVDQLPQSVPDPQATFEPGNLATNAEDYFQFDIQEFFHDDDDSFLDAAGW
jgi:hypothetical protein